MFSITPPNETFQYELLNKKRKAIPASILSVAIFNRVRYELLRFVVENNFNLQNFNFNNKHEISKKINDLQKLSIDISNLAIKSGLIGVTIRIADNFFKDTQNEYSKNNFNIKNWLAKIELTQYYDNFKNNDIDKNTLFGLNENDLKEIGINSLGHRKIIFEEIQKIKPKNKIQKIYDDVSNSAIKMPNVNKEKTIKENELLKTIFHKGHSRIEWFKICWQNHFNNVRKSWIVVWSIFFSFDIFLIIGTLFMIGYDDVHFLGIILMTSIYIGLLFPLLLAIIPVKAKHNKIQCCSSCGKIDDTLRVVNYKVGATIAGLYPQNWNYERVLCDKCRKGRVKFAILCQNYINVWFKLPFSIIHGPVNIIRNLTTDKITIYSKTIKLTKELIEHAKQKGFEEDVEKLTKSLKEHELIQKKRNNKYRKIKQ